MQSMNRLSVIFFRWINILFKILWFVRKIVTVEKKEMKCFHCLLSSFPVLINPLKVVWNFYLKINTDGE